MHQTFQRRAVRYSFLISNDWVLNENNNMAFRSNHMKMRYFIQVSDIMYYNLRLIGFDYNLIPFKFFRFVEFNPLIDMHKYTF